MTLTHERLLTLVHYDAETGVFRWLVTRGGRKPGDVIASKQNGGYLVGRIDWQGYLLHRLAWFYVHGAWPGELDHINRDRADNRIVNLRECDRAGNAQNVSAHVNGSSRGVIGASWNKRARKWMAQLVVNGKHHYLGLFADKHQAGEAYLNAKRQLHKFAGEDYAP